MDHVDGNALSGPLSDLFGRDLTQVSGVCASCSQWSMLAETHVYQQAPGLVARCPHCGYAVATVVPAPRGLRLGLTGLRFLEIPTASS